MSADYDDAVWSYRAKHFGRPVGWAEVNGRYSGLEDSASWEREWSLDYHHPLGVTPLGCLWVEDGYDVANKFAASELGVPWLARDVRVFGDGVFYRTSVHAFEGSTAATRRVVMTYKSLWLEYIASSTREHDRLIEAVARADASTTLGDLLISAREFQVTAWRLHFRILYAFLNEIAAQSEDRTPNARFADGAIASPPQLTAVDAYLGELHRSLMSSSPDDAVRSVVDRLGDRYVFAPDPGGPVLSESPELATKLVDAWHARSPSLAGSADGLSLAYAWWNESHHAAIEWRAGLPLRSIARRAAELLGISPDLFPYLFFDELSVMVGGRAHPTDLLSVLRARRDAHLSSSNSVDSSAIPSPEAIQRLGVSPGVATGTAAYMIDPSGVDFPDGAVLVCHGVVPSFVGRASRAAGLLVVGGSALSHASIICQTLGIPCIVGLDAMEAAGLDGRHVSIDGGSGRIVVGRRGM